MDLAVTLHGRATSEDGTVVPIPDGGVQYTSLIELRAKIVQPLKLYWQPVYWYEPNPVLTIKRGAGSYLEFQQINLAPLVVPEPAPLWTLVGGMILIGAACRGLPARAVRPGNNTDRHWGFTPISAFIGVYRRPYRFWGFLPNNHIGRR